MYDVQLNHMYLVVDRETYDAITHSPLISSFALTYEQKNSADNEMGWEGFYIRGKNTYIEFFYPQKRYPSIGISGIGMGVDYPGSLASLHKELPHFNWGQFSRNGKPWFYYLAIGDSYFYKRNSFWIMEYASEYFEENTQDISRARYNLEKYDKNKPFLDLKKIVIALRPEGIEALENCLRGLNLKAQNGSYFTSENIEIQLVKQNENVEGICQIEFTLAMPFREIASCRLGNSFLNIQADKGSWTFFQTD